MWLRLTTGIAVATPRATRQKAREESARDVSIDSLTADLWSDSQASEPVPRARVARHTPRRLCRGRDANGPCHGERLNLWRSGFKDRDVGFLAGESSLLLGNSFLIGVGRFLSKGNDGARCQKQL